MVPAKYTITFQSSSASNKFDSQRGDLEVPDWYYDDGDELVLTSALSGFGDCDALLDHLRTEGAERVGPWGFDHGGWFGGPVAFADAPAAI